MTVDEKQKQKKNEKYRRENQNEFYLCIKFMQCFSLVCLLHIETSVLNGIQVYVF